MPSRSQQEHETRRLVSHLLAERSLSDFFIHSKTIKSDNIRGVLNRITQFEKMESEVARLKRQLAFLQNARSTPDAARGESLVASWVRGEHTSPFDDSDVLISGTGVKLEVKFSRLNTPYTGAATRRWSWQKILGEYGNKRYNRLILIGEKDPRFRKYYLDSRGPWVIFDVPFKAVQNITISSGRWRLIQLSSDPRTATSTASVLYEKYQVSSKIIEEKYGEE